MTIQIIAIDAMGGDHGLSVTVPAAIDVLKHNSQVHLILVGQEDQIKQQLASLHFEPNERLSVYPATQTVAMDESPTMALRSKKDSSMRVAINLVKDGKAHACVSAGNTGALMATAHFVLRTLPGIDRPAISAILPTMQNDSQVRMLDLGANVDSDVDNLFQFAVMGSVLASAVDHIKNPRVGLLNIGSEEIKGNEQVKKAAQLLANIKEINYIGYLEGDDIFKGTADVIVCDGFVGNVALKVTEGVIKFLGRNMKTAFNRNWWTRISGLAALHVLKSVGKKFDPARYNGATLLGLQGVVIKSHGSANAHAFANAINVAALESEQNIPQRIRDQVAHLLQQKDA